MSTGPAIAGRANTNVARRTAAMISERFTAYPPSRLFALPAHLRYKIDAGLAAPNPDNH